MDTDARPVRRPQAGLFALTGLLALTACGGGGSGAGSSAPTVGQAQLTPLFAATLSTAGPSDPGTVALKACIMTAQQTGTASQSGSDFLDSLVIEVLPEATAPLYNARTGQVESYTKRAYKGSNGAAGAPPILWGGVAGMVNNEFVGFGAPCSPTTMTTSPPSTCYWLVDSINGQAHVATNYVVIEKSHPETSSAGAPLANVGWNAGPAYQFWYEASPGTTCSAPGSQTIWHNP